MKRLIILLLLIPLASADIISINSAGSTEIVLTPQEIVEGFFFQVFPDEIISGGGGGGAGGVPLAGTVSMCNDIYFYLEKYGDDERPDAVQLILEIDETTSREYSWNEFQLIMNSWQDYCSMIVMRTLNEEAVCQEIGLFLEDHQTPSDGELNVLKSIIDRDIIPIELPVLTHYVRNFNSACGVKRVFSIAPLLSGGVGLLFVILAIFLMLLYYYRLQTRKIWLIFFKRKKKKERDLGEDILKNKFSKGY